eukprot:gene24821-biopygen2946
MTPPERCAPLLDSCPLNSSSSSRNSNSRAAAAASEQQQQQTSSSSRSSNSSSSRAAAAVTTTAGLLWPGPPPPPCARSSRSSRVTGPGGGANGGVGSPGTVLCPAWACRSVPCSATRHTLPGMEQVPDPSPPERSPTPPDGPCGGGPRARAPQEPLHPRPHPGRNGCGRVPDASHTIDFEETDASRRRPEPFPPERQPRHQERRAGPHALGGVPVCGLCPMGYPPVKKRKRLH